MTKFQPREAQKEVLKYDGGYLAVSAVPGSGKTATIAALAAKIIAHDLPLDGQVLIVTYQNAAVNNVRNRVRRHLKDEYDLPAAGFDVRTLHSLSNLILKANPGLAGLDNNYHVLDQRAARSLLQKAVRIWYNQNHRLWDDLLPTDNPEKFQKQLPDLIYGIARAVINTAKNQRLNAGTLLHLVDTHPENVGFFLKMAAEIYHLYQQQAQTVGGLDFSDLVWKAVDLLETHQDLRKRLRERWCYVLEDEAQDSIPLQQDLLSLLVGKEGNWVRVGDPNQSIMSTFTAADPKFFKDFTKKYRSIELPESGRCAQRIINLANHLVKWVGETHPIDYIRQETFNGLMIQPTQPDDPQQNPPDAKRNIIFTEYYDRDEELSLIASRAVKFTRAHPEKTLAILVSTNKTGYKVVEMLEGWGVKYDELLQITNTSREVADTIAKVLLFLGDPLDKNRLPEVYQALVGVNQQLKVENPKKMEGFLRSCYRPEVLLFPAEDDQVAAAFPDLGQFPAIFFEKSLLLADYLRRWMFAITLPIDQLIMTIAQDIFLKSDLDREEIHAKLATAQKISSYLRSWADQNLQFRLPELANELDLMTSGKHQTKFVGLSDEDYGFEPKPGVITVTTMHRAKGLEWDLVYLAGVTRNWFPMTLDDHFMGVYDFLEGDPQSEASANLLMLMNKIDMDGYSPTEMSHLETIAERLRLLYVGITRAKRHLSISASSYEGVAESYQELYQHHLEY